MLPVPIQTLFYEFGGSFFYSQNFSFHQNGNNIHEIAFKLYYFGIEKKKIRMCGRYPPPLRKCRLRSKIRHAINVVIQWMTDEDNSLNSSKKMYSKIRIKCAVLNRSDLQTNHIFSSVLSLNLVYVVYKQNITSDLLLFFQLILRSHLSPFS